MARKKVEKRQVQLNSEELKDFLRHVVDNNQHIQTQGKVPVSVSVTGEAGTGKTSSIIELAQELNFDLVKINLAQVEEIGDLVGFPVKEFQIQNAEGKTTWIVEQQIDAAVKKGYKIINKRMAYAAPEWIQGKGEGGILLIDDFNRADTRFTQACMELIDRQEYISWKLPKNWHIILSQNPDDGDYMVNAQDLAQQTRYISVDFKFDVNVWAKWAERNNVDSRAINFMLMHPELVTKETNARIITKFFDSISSIPKFEDKLPLIQMIGEGSVGIDFSSMFTMFINNKLDKIISPEDILTKDEAYVVGALKGAVGDGDDFRADISSVIATRVINYSLHFAETKSVPDAMIKRLIKLTTDCDSFTDDLKYYIIKEVVNGNKLKFSKLMMDPTVVKMAVK
jgi:nucleoside-triphosphatase THEP1